MNILTFQAAHCYLHIAGAVAEFLKHLGKFERMSIVLYHLPAWTFFDSSFITFVFCLPALATSTPKSNGGGLSISQTVKSKSL